MVWLLTSVTVMLTTLLSGDQAVPINNAVGPGCRTEYVTTWERQYLHAEDEECKNVIKKVPVKISKLEPKKICNQLSCKTEQVRVWVHQDYEVVTKECETVQREVPTLVSKKVKKTVCDDFNYDDHDNNIISNEIDNNPPKAMELPCWSGSLCPSDTISIVMG